MRIAGNAAGAVLDVLSASGVTTVFASPGSEWAPLWEAIARKPDEIEYISVGHEELAVAMAAGFAKATQRMPAVVLHTTVGLLHASMALRAALHEQLPMVVLTGESVGFGEVDGPDPGEQWLSHLTDMGGPAALAEQTVKWAARLLAPELLPSMLHRAANIARESPPGPVVLSTPMEYLFKDIDTNLTIADMRRAGRADNVLGEVASDLADSAAPLIVTEEVGRSPDLVAVLVDIAEMSGAMVAETRGTRFMNFPRSHPLHSGFEPETHLDTAETILLLGVLAPWHPSSRRPKSVRRITAIRENPLRSELPYWGYQVDVLVNGDLDQSLLTLRDALRPFSENRKVDRLAQIGTENSTARLRLQTEASRYSIRETIHPRWAAHVLGRELPKNAVLVDETITPRKSLLELITHLQPASYFAGAIGGLGTGLGTALGVKLVNPDRPVVCVIGDGSLGYEPVIAALSAAQQLELPILVVVLNNAGYLSQKATIAQYFPDGAAVRSTHYPGMDIDPVPDLDVLARAFGGDGETVDHPQAVAHAVRRGLESISDGKLHLVDVRMEPVSRLDRRYD